MTNIFFGWEDNNFRLQYFEQFLQNIILIILGGIIIIKRIISFVIVLSFFVNMPFMANADAGSVQLKDITMAEKTNSYSYSIKYPKAINAKSEQKINEKIESTMNYIKNQAINMIETSPDKYVDLTSVYEVTQNKKNKLSLLFKSTIEYGGAHPIDLQIALTFNTKTGELYSLHDLFPEKPDYVKLINDEIKKQLKSDFYNNTEFYRFDSIDKDQSFYIKDDKLIIFFGQYTYAPRHFGFAEFIMPDNIFLV